MTSLSGKVIAITGAASGIGLATAYLLSFRDASVSLADVQAERLAAVTADIQTSSPHALVHHQVVNVAHADEVAHWLDETVKQLGGLHGTANLAGVLGVTGRNTIKDMEDEEWDFVMDEEWDFVMDEDWDFVMDEEWDFVMDVNLKGFLIVLERR